MDKKLVLLCGHFKSASAKTLSRFSVPLRLKPHILVVTKLDRLGRNAMDVRATVEQLASLGVRV
ncbi:MAG: recombinase family protein, partial [Methylococcaceae bacterium]